MSFKVEQGLGNRNDLIISDIESKYKEASATPSSSTKPKTETMLGKICVFVVDKAFNYSDEAILKGCPLLYAISKIAKKAEPYLQKTQFYQTTP